MRKNNKKRHGGKKSYERARRAIHSDVTRAREVETPPDYVQRHCGSFVIKRALSESHVEETIRKCLKGSPQRALRLLGVSIISPREAFWLIGTTERHGREFEIDHAKKVVKEEMAEPLSIKASGFCILGAKRNEAGMRYVSMTFDRRGCGQLQGDRDMIYKAYGYDGATRFSIPHLSVAQTPNQTEAENIVSTLRDTEIPGSLVDLGPARLTPVIHSRTTTR